MKNTSQKLVLIIDDSEDNQTLLKTLFNAKGFEVQCASNGSEALLLLRELSILPDLIFLDAQMPIMDGYEFRIQQRLSARLKNIPVIVMTADTDIEVAEKMFYPKNILIKPLQFEKLIDSISQLQESIKS